MPKMDHIQKKVARIKAGRENKVEDHLRTLVESKGGLCLKFVSPGNRGVMDRITLLPGGVVCFDETKTKNGVLSPQQKFRKKQFEDLGLTVHVIKDKKTADDIYG